MSSQPAEQIGRRGAAAGTRRSPLGRPRCRAEADYETEKALHVHIAVSFRRTRWFAKWNLLTRHNNEVTGRRDNGKRTCWGLESRTKVQWAAEPEWLSYFDKKGASPRGDRLSPPRTPGFYTGQGEKTRR